MVEPVPWRSDVGIVFEKTGWRLHERQLPSILHILDGQDCIHASATGDGKSALFLAPLLCHLAVSAEPERYPEFAGQVRERPVGIVVMPTKGLARNVVETARKLGLASIAFDRETLAAAAAEGRNLEEEIGSRKFQLVCVDPEHLSTPAWRRIFEFKLFVQNLVLTCLEEGHLLGEWLLFRKAYAIVASFIRGRVRSHTSVFAMSATIEPGEPLATLQRLGGFREHEIFRHSNERHNVQFTVKPLQHALKNRSYPQLLPYLNAGRKTVI
uniref:Helicase ATP-binding domain-containing protein n=1 Tax=Mycena chlorophos TaxID=658473 RepID=A0ABQ0LRE8_MYCCL|nr:predicted protein [Mycena chlorophos]